MRRSSCVIHFLYRYAAKAQSPDKLLRTSLTGRERIAANRVHAIENSPRGLALAHVAKSASSNLDAKCVAHGRPDFFDEASDVLTGHLRDNEVRALQLSPQ